MRADLKQLKRETESSRSGSLVAEDVPQAAAAASGSAAARVSSGKMKAAAAAVIPPEERNADSLT
ncbi:MAG: hypothetical protein WA188_05570 [Terriglobales bacterium]